MSIQDIFYITYIVIGILALALLVAITIYGFRTMRRVDKFVVKADARFDSISEKLEHQIDATGKMIDQPGEAAAEVMGTMVATIATNLMRNAGKMFRKSS